jgi:hypothetical protein
VYYADSYSHVVRSLRSKAFFFHWWNVLRKPFISFLIFIFLPILFTFCVIFLESPFLLVFLSLAFSFALFSFFISLSLFPYQYLSSVYQSWYKKNFVFWDVICAYCKNQCFGGTYRPDHQVKRIGENYEECRLLGYKAPVRKSEETYYLSTTQPNRLTLSTIWGSLGGEYEEIRLLGYKTSARTSQETHYFSTKEPSGLMLCETWGFTVVTMKTEVFWDIKL